MPDVARHEAFRRPLDLPGCTVGSTWGFDPILESYWAEAVLTRGGSRLVVDPTHLVGTVTGLAQVLDAALLLRSGSALAALLGHITAGEGQLPCGAGVLDVAS